MQSDPNSYKKSSFGPAFFFLGKRRRAALAAYYEFCRLIDDIADEPHGKNPEQELDFWQQEVGRIYNHTAQTELGKFLTEITEEFKISPDRFLLLIEGMRADVQGKTYDTLQALNWYLYRVAVIVGLATLDILGVTGSLAQSLAEKLGTAVQLTNIIRDVAEDAALKRVYLPTDLLKRYDLTREIVLTGKLPAKGAQLLSDLAQVAQSSYIEADKIMAQLPPLKMLPCRMMACVYAKNLAKIKKAGFLSARQIKLTKAEKMMGVLYAMFKTIFA